jgi:hypothetical protein
MENKETELTDKELLFINTYLTNGRHITKAYLVVHPNAKKSTAATEGSKLLKNPKIIEALRIIQEETAKKMNITKEELISDLITIKNNNMGNGSTSFASIKAIEVLNKMLGYNSPDKQEIDMKNTITWNETKSYKK